MVIVKARKITIDGVETGKWRLIATIDEPVADIPMCDCPQGHDSEEDACNCPEAQKKAKEKYDLEVGEKIEYKRFYYVDFLHEPYEPVKVVAKNMDDATILAKAERIKRDLNHEVRAVTEGDIIVAAYSRKECIVHYCPTPDICKRLGKCKNT